MSFESVRDGLDEIGLKIDHVFATIFINCLIVLFLKYLIIVEYLALNLFCDVEVEKAAPWLHIYFSEDNDKWPGPGIVW